MDSVALQRNCYVKVKSTSRALIALFISVNTEILSHLIALREILQTIDEFKVSF